MRTSLGAYNFSLAHTPNIDKLASESLTFKRAYVQYGARPSAASPPHPPPAPLIPHRPTAAQRTAPPAATAS